MAGLGWSRCSPASLNNRFWNHHQSNWTAPATAGAEKLVPLEQVNRLVMSCASDALQMVLEGGRGVGSFGLGPRARSCPTSACDSAPRIEEPGATICGTVRPSSVGPNELKCEISRALSPSCGKVTPQVSTFSEAPTAMMFLAVAGGVTSTSPYPPTAPTPLALPPANTRIISWLTGFCPGVSLDPDRTESRTSSSWIWELLS